jgi:hypothetical protein
VGIESELLLARVGGVPELDDCELLIDDCKRIGPDEVIVADFGNSEVVNM